jgi:very-short-patch-repair endonuclease
MRSSEAGARLRLAAAALSLGREVPACLHTAAELHGFDVLQDPDTHVAVTGPSACLRRPGLWPHQLILGPYDLVRLRCGSVTTGPDRTAIDLARTLPRIDVLAVLDAALACGACSQDTLLSELARHRGLRGVRQARELVPLADPRAESPQESRLRQLCHDAKLPAPDLQVAVPGEPGRHQRFVDLGWHRAKVGIEYDGWESHRGRDRHRADRKRHNWFQGIGWTIFYATDLDIYGDHRPLMAGVAAALSR